MPAHGRASAYEGGAWKAKRTFESLSSHFDGPPSEYVPSRLAIIRSGARSWSRTRAKRARPPSGGSPYFDPGVVSPTQPTSMTFSGVAVAVGDGDAEGLAAATADGDGVGAAPRSGPPKTPPALHAQAPAASAAATTATPRAPKSHRRRPLPALR